MLSSLDFEKTCIKWVNAGFKIKFESIFVEVAEASPKPNKQFKT